MNTSRRPTVSEAELFRICRKTYSEGIARVTSVALYWSQFAEHRFRGKIGIYKTGEDLGEALCRHPKTAGKNLMKVCTPLGKESRTALFEVSYGPKAGQDGGRCRWLFLTPRGQQIIQSAVEDRLNRQEAKRGRQVRREGRHASADAPSDDITNRQSVDEVRTNRRPQNTPTHYTEDLPTRRSINLSAAPREISIEDSQEGQEEETEKINRIPELWKIACQRCGRRDLVWRQSDVGRFADQFSEIESMRAVRDLADEKLLERLILLCGDLDRVFPDMSEAFCDFNKKGLKAQSFATYGGKLLELAEAKLSTKGVDTKSMKQLADWG
jgi:hypothetical protein